MNRLRVLHVVGNLDLGGSQKLTVLVAAGLDRARFDVTVLNLGPPGPYDDYLLEHGIKVIDLNIPMRPRPGDIGRTARGLVRLMRIVFSRPGWHVVHTHLFRTSLLVALPARLAGARLFGTVHRIYYRWQPPVERMLAPLHEAIVVDSAAVGRILRAQTHIPANKYVVIHNGIDVTEFDAAPSREEARKVLGLPDDVVVITEIAHLVAHKGQRHLVAALARMADRSARLLLVGDGPDRHGLEGLAADLGVADRVTLTGSRRDLPVILAASDIVALPSTFEGFGIVQAEAMYMSLPVIATDAGGSTEVVVDSETGYLVRFGDVRSLAERLDRLDESRLLRRAFGEAGRERVVNSFTQQVMVSRYADMYDGNDRGGANRE